MYGRTLPKRRATTVLDPQRRRTTKRDPIPSDSEKETPGATQTPFTYQKNFNSSGETKTVILFGEAGAGKSSLVNFMAGSKVAKTSSGLSACTLQATEYPFALSSSDMSLRLFDTVGLGEPSPTAFVGAIKQAYNLIQTLHNAGGVDLLLFCMRAGRITDPIIRDYHLFFDFLCNKEVPVAIVITHLENEREGMDAWWANNGKEFKKYGIEAVDHACITTLLDSETTRHYAEQRVQSWDALRNLFDRTLVSKPARKSSYVKDVLDWLGAFLANIRLGFRKSAPSKEEREDILAQLKKTCRMSQEQAQKVAEIVKKGSEGTGSNAY